MAVHLFNVDELFDIEGRGVVVVTDLTYETVAASLRIGDRICIKGSSGDSLITSIAGIEHFDPSAPRQRFSFLLPLDVRKEDIPIGSSVFSVSN